MKNIETISHEGETLAIIIRHNHYSDGVDFLTPDHYPQQLAFMGHGAGKIIQAHIHNKIPRQIDHTSEVLVIRKGTLKANIYDKNKKFISTHELGAGDIILLAAGGHGFEAISDVEMIEIKQGPFLGDQDKVRFS